MAIEKKHRIIIDTNLFHRRSWCFSPTSYTNSRIVFGTADHMCVSALPVLQQVLKNRNHKINFFLLTYFRTRHFSPTRPPWFVTHETQGLTTARESFFTAEVGVFHQLHIPTRASCSAPPIICVYQRCRFATSVKKSES